jgi:hypothetical protein
VTGIPDDLADELLDRWLPGAMFPSELLWLAEQLVAARVDAVIECGRQDGVSTWALGTVLAGTGGHLWSIDFDLDRERRRRVEDRLSGLPVTCVSGDVHHEVPRLLRSGVGGRVAVVQDGPKGWEGMATLLAAALDRRVVLAAQHNLHRGHRSRTAFEMLSLRPAFLEQASTDEAVLGLRERERRELAGREPNRPLDHTSLGLVVLDEPARGHLQDALPLLRHWMWPWDPLRFAARWERGDLDVGARTRRRLRHHPARFRRR